MDGKETLMNEVVEGFHKNSTRRIEVEGTDSGTIIITVHTLWGQNSEDRSCVALTPEELTEINHCVNGVPQ